MRRDYCIRVSLNTYLRTISHRIKLTVESEFICFRMQKTVTRRSIFSRTPLFNYQRVTRCRRKARVAEIALYIHTYIYTWVYVCIYIYTYIYIIATWISQHKFYSLSLSFFFTHSPFPSLSLFFSLTFKRDALTLTQARTRSRLRNYYNAWIVVEFLSSCSAVPGYISDARLEHRGACSVLSRYTRSLCLSFLPCPGNSTRFARLSSLYIGRNYEYSQ